MIVPTAGPTKAQTTGFTCAGTRMIASSDFLEGTSIDLD